MQHQSIPMVIDHNHDEVERVMMQMRLHLAVVAVVHLLPPLIVTNLLLVAVHSPLSHLMSIVMPHLLDAAQDMIHLIYLLHADRLLLLLLLLSSRLCHPCHLCHQPIPLMEIAPHLVVPVALAMIHLTAIEMHPHLVDADVMIHHLIHAHVHAHSHHLAVTSHRHDEGGGGMIHLLHLVHMPMTWIVRHQGEDDDMTLHHPNETWMRLQQLHHPLPLQPLPLRRPLPPL